MTDIDNADLSPDALIASINARLGRPLRVLHIGNIANNAYNNARIQRQYGIEADVICHDYYHVMATPEWEDGGLTTPVDPNLPDWWSTNLKGFRRPDWYVQGPLLLCLEYLHARGEGDWIRQGIAAVELEKAYRSMLARAHPLPLTARFENWVSALRGRLRGSGKDREQGTAGTSAVGIYARQWSSRRLLTTFLSAMRASPRTIRAFPESVRHEFSWPLLAASQRDQPIAGGKLVLAAFYAARRMLRRDRDRDAEVLETIRLHVRPTTPPFGWALALSQLLKLSVELLRNILIGSIALPIARWTERNGFQRLLAPEDARAAAIETKIGTLVGKDRWQAMTPERRELFLLLARNALLFGPILKHYDIVQGYSIDGFTPLMNDFRAFACYEHGTLRDLPFEDSITGLICEIAYRNAPETFVTNTDVLPSAWRLGLDRKHVHNLPHAFDDQKLVRWRSAHATLAPPAEVTFFSPTRQHWRDANLSLTKGNDVMLHAAGRLWAEGRRFRLVMVEWGHDIEASRALIRSLGYEEAVQWVPPMGKQDLWRAYCTSHAVLDQFILPALGGVGFETLTLGCRLITLVDAPTLADFFGAAPPVMPAVGIDDVAASMRKIMDDPLDHAGIGEAGRQWIETWHSARRTVAIQARVYRDMLAPQDGQPG